MGIRRVRLHTVRLPFKRRYRHAAADRVEADGLILEVELDGGGRGFGEALPREYVTGETLASVHSTLADDWAAAWDAVPTDRLAAAWEWLAEPLERATAERTLAAYGAAELALLDAVGRATDRSVAECLGHRVRRRINYTGPITAGSVTAARRLARLMRLGRLQDVKVKVGFANDREVVAAVRDGLGPRIDLRVDANGAWTPDEAIAHVHALAPYHISGVEQPVPRDDVAGLARVQAAVDVPVIADESACTPADVSRLATARACNMINVRVGKCGGLRGALQTIATAERHDLAWHIGCLVGETALLSAAGRHLAFGVDGWCYVEGSYGPFLLERDIARPQPRWGWRASARPLTGPGLGVRVDPDALAAVTTATVELR